MKAAARLQAIRDEWDARRPLLEDALLSNRKIWTIFVTNMSADDCPLPPAIRSNIINLGMFVFNRTIQLSIDPQPDQLSALIDINRNLAAGLRGDAGVAERAAA